MTFVELVQIAMVAGLGFAAATTLGIAVFKYRRQRPVKVEGDCREHSLAMYGEVVRRDC